MNQTKGRKTLVLLGIMVFIIVVSVMVTKLFSKTEEDTSGKLTIVTSFFPIYVASANVVDGMENVELVNLTENVTGCLHDYQLTAKDMKKLEKADVFIINGGGMEGFIEEVINNYPDITVIDASEGIPLIDSETSETEETSEEQQEDQQDEHKEETNAHVWMNPGYYLVQIQNIKNGLCSYDKQNSEKYDENADNYSKKVEEIKQEFETLSDPVNDQIVIFHNSFAYLAQQLGLTVAHTVDMDGETSLSAGEIAEVVDEVNEKQIKVLITEKQFADTIANSIAKETDAKVYVLNSLVTGEFNKNAYIEGMKENLETIKKALY